MGTETAKTEVADPEALGPFSFAPCSLAPRSSTCLHPLYRLFACAGSMSRPILAHLYIQCTYSVNVFVWAATSFSRVAACAAAAGGKARELTHFLQAPRRQGAPGPRQNVAVQPATGSLGCS